MCNFNIGFHFCYKITYIRIRAAHYYAAMVVLIEFHYILGLIFCLASAFFSSPKHIIIHKLLSLFMTNDMLFHVQSLFFFSPLILIQITPLRRKAWPSSRAVTAWRITARKSPGILSPGIEPKTGQLGKHESIVTRKYEREGVSKASGTIFASGSDCMLSPQWSSWPLES